MDLSVADELAYDALDADTRALCDKIITRRIEDRIDRAMKDAETQLLADLSEEWQQKGFQSGYRKGRDDAFKEAADKKQKPA